MKYAYKENANKLHTYTTDESSVRIRVRLGYPGSENLRAQCKQR